MYITIIDPVSNEVKTWKLKCKYVTPDSVDAEILAKGHDPRNVLVSFSVQKPHIYVEKDNQTHNPVNSSNGTTQSSEKPEEPYSAMISALYNNIAESLSAHDFIQVFTQKLLDVKSLIKTYQNLPRTMRSKSKMVETLTEAIFAIHMLSEFYNISDSVQEAFDLNLKSNYKELTE